MRFPQRALIGIALVFAISFTASALGRTIGERTARKLAKEALVTMGEDERSAHLGPWEFPWAPEFYTFSAWWPGLDHGDGVSVLQTYYLAVNPWTGDVWDAIGCSRITSPAIQKEQKNLRNRSKLSAEVWEFIHGRTPAGCSELKPDDH
jgi:hypothetical protein